MVDSNFRSKWWGYIYDQMMVEGLSDWAENHRRFYLANLKDIKGPVLECACGTGFYLLPFLQAGYNIYGFDISESMLSTLLIKAKALGVADIQDRISVQDLESFRYEQRFEAILIPSNTFPMLVSQEAQILALRNIHAHLAPGGKLLLDFKINGLRELVETPEIEEGNWYTWKHPETGLPIRQRVVGRVDYTRQLIMDQCFIEYEGQAEDFPMTARWIFKDEFELLLRLGGFEHWECFGTPERDQLVVGLDGTHSYWIVQK